MRKPVIVVMILAAALAATACSSGGSSGGDRIVLGALFADDVDGLSRLELYGVRLAVEDINASGAFIKPLEVATRSPARGDVIDQERVRQGVMELFDQEGAVAYVSGHGGESSLTQNEVTNQEPYSKFVRCANTANEPTSNVPGLDARADVTDTFYRLVVNWGFHLDFGAWFFEQRQLLKVGLIRIDDDIGAMASLYIRRTINDLSDHGFSLAFDKAVSPDAFVLADNKDWLDEIIALSHEGGVDVTVIVTFQAQTNGIVKYLTENDFRSALFLNTSSTTADMFDIATGLSDWLAQPGNDLFSLNPDNYSGPHGQEFIEKFRTRFDEEPSPYSSTAYECAFTLALAMLYSGQEVPVAPGVWENMPKFKEEQRSEDEVEVGIGSDEFARAAQLIAEGKRINFVGASGRIIFDENGDRPGQGMCIMGPNAGATAWEVKECYDENFQKL